MCRLLMLKIVFQVLQYTWIEFWLAVKTTANQSSQWTVGCLSSVAPWAHTHSWQTFISREVMGVCCCQRAPDPGPGCIPATCWMLTPRRRLRFNLKGKESKPRIIHLHSVFIKLLWWNLTWESCAHQCICSLTVRWLSSAAFNLLAWSKLKLS